MKIKGAIFDMDGTIVDSLMFWDYLWERIGTEYMNDPVFRPCDEVNKKVRTMIYTEAMEYFRAYYKLSVSPEDFFTFASSGVHDFYVNVSRIKGNADKLLEYLKSQNIKLCLASATAMPEIKLALEHHGMIEYFDVILSCVDIGVGKDKPDIYLKAKELMGISTEDICVFEDSYVALETAKNAGFKTVGIFDRYNFEQRRLEEASDIYLPEGKTLDCLAEKIGR